MKLLYLMICVLALSGCMGTVITRFDGEKSDVAGRYPFQAVGLDFSAIGASSPASLAGLVSIPFDIVGDVIGLPFDLILWPFGFTKNDKF